MRYGDFSFLGELDTRDWEDDSLFFLGEVSVVLGR